jgi:hypothetical protein
MLDFGGLNWVAILVTTLVSFAIGGIWYGPLFGKAWFVAVEKTREQLPSGATPFVVSFVTALITSIVFAALIAALGITSPVQGAALGLILGIGFIATSTASDGAFCAWRLNLVLIQAGYRVVYSIVMGAVLAWWQ